MSFDFTRQLPTGGRSLPKFGGNYTQWNRSTHSPEGAFHCVVRVK